MITRLFSRLRYLLPLAAFAALLILPGGNAAGWVPPTTPRNFTVLEAIGTPGTTITIAMQVPSGGTGLWIKAHGLSYQNKASIRVNGGEWIALNNTNCVFDYPGDRLKGMGGPLDTLSFRVLGVSLVPRRANTISFRFNYSDGLSIGYRILDVNVLNASGRRLLPESKPAFVRPRSSNLSASDILAGSNLWYNGQLRANWIGDQINAKCSDCHAETGEDLKYYSFSDRAISERARFHGLTLAQGRQIASYIKSLPGKTPGTPWDPPFQPGPGLDAKPADEFAAGAGLKWVLPDDSLSFDYMFTNGEPSVNFTNTLNIREMPIALPMPDWNSWLPHVHWKDSYGSNNFKIVIDAYDAIRNANTPGEVVLRFNEWNAKLSDWMNGPAAEGPADLRDGSNKAWRAWWSVARWRTVKSWEILKAKNYEDRAKEMFDFPVESRSWPTHTVFLSSPHFTIGIQNGHFIRDGGVENWYILSHQWYWLQMILNDSNHRRLGSFPIDWPYLESFTSKQLYWNLGAAAQNIAALIKAGEATTFDSRSWLDGFTGFNAIRTEYLWAREGADMWAGYDPAYRDAIIRAWLTEYSKKIHELGREHFRDVTGEIRDGETDNTPGAPNANPWIRSHAGMLVFFQSKGTAPDIVESMRELGQFLWPDADWTKF